MHKTLSALVSLVLFLLVHCGVQAQARRETLKGHQSIGVIVEELTSEIENKGITRAQLQADVELALRKAGIKVDNNSPRLSVFECQYNAN